MEYCPGCGARLAEAHGGRAPYVYLRLKARRYDVGEAGRINLRARCAACNEPVFIENLSAFLHETLDKARPPCVYSG